MRGCACRGTAGLVHVSCLAEQAKILVAEALENNLDAKAFDERWRRWGRCSLCEQDYHGVVRCALGWACWKTYVGRPEANQVRQVRGMAMSQLGNGLYAAAHDEDALTVREAELAVMRRLGASVDNILIVQGNLASSYHALGRTAEALRYRRDVYAGYLKLHGEEHENTLREATCCAMALTFSSQFEEAKSLTRKMMPVTQRVLGESHEYTLKMRWVYADALFRADGATLADLREAVKTLEETERTARRVFGGEHPFTGRVEGVLRDARAALRARDAPA